MSARILVVEDEPLIADDIAETLEKQGHQVIGIVDEADDAEEVIEKETVDLVLLDINIEGDRDGIELARKLTVPFIFLTSYYDEKTLSRARETEPNGYLVKPFNPSELLANVEMALYQTHRKKVSVNDPEKLFVRKDQEIVSLLSSDILFVEAFDNYANAYTSDHKYIISHTLKSIESKLVPLGFIRIHRSYLVNFDRIDSISEGYIFIEGQKVPIGKSYRKAFFEKLSML